ncbi:MAG: secondary thiamine-phosphate synthase enzyme YjbQ [Candidatus Neomarinimicrobiota bacterium]|jgi:secondary thiamine-phosphate synthase enzyme
MSSWHQVEIQLPPFPRGFHIITVQIEDALKAINQLKVGTLHIFIKHTSASIAINEGADPSVRIDFETHFNKLVPEDSPDFIHNAEGPDDMPAHIKSALLGTSLQIPITHSKMNLGTWQEVYLCEHRNNASGRTLVLTLNGTK